ncbi:MAG: thioredoxin [Treponemataceae bacterium]|nr:thioredoxin [Treponemataceae bacterium]
MAEITLTKDTFKTEVLDYEGTVLVDFWAPWCGPCRATAPYLAELAEEHPEIKVGKINVDEEEELAGMFNIMSIPTLMVFKGGKSVKREVGGRDKEGLLELLG